MLPLVTFHLPDAPALTRTIASGDVVGRDPAVAVSLPHASISRRHARFDEAGDGRWSIVDLGSKNGLRVDGYRVEQATLAHGQWFAVGDVFAFFSLQTRYEPFARGLIDTRAVVYFISIAVFCSLVAFRNLESRKWK